MTKRPYFNATLASLYITLVASIMFNAGRLFGPVNSVLVPIAMISLFTLSAAVMGYLFLYQPILLFLEGRRKSAVNLFLQTVAFFAGITATLFILLLLRIVK